MNLKRSPSADCRPEIYRIYGSKVFREAIIRERLQKSIYESYLNTIEIAAPLDPKIAPEVARVMMEWAIQQGATHYAHWFLPLTNNTACKHDAFFTPSSVGEAKLEFPSNTLVRGEPDASSFPSGGLRATFEARGYTTWDPTSPAFVRDGTLYIPSVFISYTGDALDRKVPLLKSCEALNEAGLRLLKFFPVRAQRLTASAGAEQEYFLISRELYKRRPDLRLCGRTLLGALPIRGQQLDDHYMGHIRVQVANYMASLDEELWEIGVPAKTKHNEVAPSQHELAPVFENVNIASDHNQMTMEMMRTVAKKNGLACLLHEKPFAGLNGSGKHNNYSIITDGGYNLFKPCKPEKDGSLFLITMCAFIRAVDIYADLLRMSAASPSNDQRLGGFEAPPSIVSIFLGEQILNQLISAARGSADEGTTGGVVKIVPVIPHLSLDDSDRNRTSPLAFTGNKFEFRMPGSSQSIAQINSIINTIVSDSFNVFADRLEKAADPEQEKTQIIIDTINEHGRIIFNGNNYSSEWIEEAKKRGLPIITNTVDALDAYRSDRNIALFERHHVLSRNECLSRYEVELESYVKTVSIEAKLLAQMVEREVLPAVQEECGRRAQAYHRLERVGAASPQLRKSLESIVASYDSIYSLLSALKERVQALDTLEQLRAKAVHLRDVVLAAMRELRTACDACEAAMSEANWPFPSYNELLHSL